MFCRPVVLSLRHEKIMYCHKTKEVDAVFPFPLPGGTIAVAFPPWCSKAFGRDLARLRRGPHSWKRRRAREHVFVCVYLRLALVIHNHTVTQLWSYVTDVKFHRCLLCLCVCVSPCLCETEVMTIKISRFDYMPVKSILRFSLILSSTLRTSGWTVPEALKMHAQTDITSSWYASLRSLIFFIATTIVD